MTVTVACCLRTVRADRSEAGGDSLFGRLSDRPFRERGVVEVKKGRHRRYEEARALKRNQDLDIDEIFDSLETGDGPAGEEGYSPAFEAWAEEFPGDKNPEEADLEDADSKVGLLQDSESEEVFAEEALAEEADQIG